MTDSFQKEEGFALLELIIVLVVIMILMYTVTKSSFLKPSIDKKAKGEFSREGIDTSSYKGILDSTRSKVDAINQRLSDRYKQMDDLNDAAQAH